MEFAGLTDNDALLAPEKPSRKCPKKKAEIAKLSLRNSGISGTWYSVSGTRYTQYLFRNDPRRLPQCYEIAVLAVPGIVISYSVLRIPS